MRTDLAVAGTAGDVESEPVRGRLGRRPIPVALAPAALGILALVLSFARIDAKSIVLDESVSVAWARSSRQMLFDIVTGGDPNTGLYYVLLHVWVRIAGEGELAVRSLSAVIAALTVPAIVLLGTRLFGRRTGVIAGLLLAVNAFFVQHAQFARAYSLVLLLVTLSSYFLVAELDRPSLTNRVLYVVTSALAVYAHYFAAYVLLVHLLTMLAYKRRAALRREWLAAGFAVVLLCAPAALFAYRKGAEDTIGWITRPGVRVFWDVPVALAGRSQLVLVALLAVGCLGAARAVRGHERWQEGFVVAWLVVPLAVGFVVSFAVPMIVDSYLIVSLPALVLFAAHGVATIPSRVAGGLALAAMIALSCLALDRWYRTTGHEDWRDATRSVLAESRPGDAIAFFPSYVKEPFEYYARLAGVDGPRNVYPQEQPRPDPFARDARAWLVIRLSDVPGGSMELARLQHALAVNRARIDNPVFRGLELELFVPRGRRG